MDNKKEVIARLCALVTKVGSEQFDHVHAHDCFCGLNNLQDPFFRVDEQVLQFIEQAVYEKLSRSE